MRIGYGVAVFVEVRLRLNCWSFKGPLWHDNLEFDSEGL